MRLPKHKLPKNKPTHAHKVTKRTNKHKVKKSEEIVIPADSMAVEAEEEQSDHEEMEVANQVKANIAAPKSKEERQAIREKRRETNAARNEYKRRNSNFSGKNGPRAINRSSN